MFNFSQRFPEFIMNWFSLYLPDCRLLIEDWLCFRTTCVTQVNKLWEIMANLSLFYLLDSLCDNYCMIRSRNRMRKITLSVTATCKLLVENCKTLFYDYHRKWITQEEQSANHELTKFSCVHLCIFSPWKIIIILCTTICRKYLSVTWKICSDSEVKTNLIPFVFKFVLKAWEISLTIREIITILAAWNKRLCLLVHGWQILQLG